MPPSSCTYEAEGSRQISGSSSWARGLLVSFAGTLLCSYCSVNALQCDLGIYLAEIHRGGLSFGGNIWNVVINLMRGLYISIWLPQSCCCLIVLA